jgi:hypothetical protein
MPLKVEEPRIPDSMVEPVMKTMRGIDLVSAILRHAKEKRQYTNTCHMTGDRFNATYNGAVLTGMLMVLCPIKAQSILTIDETAKTVTVVIEYKEIPGCHGKVVFVYDQ